MKPCKKHPDGERYASGKCKLCQNEHNAQWDAANPEKRRAIQKRWVQLNPEKVRIKKKKGSARQRAANPEKYRNRSRRACWRKAGIDPVLAEAVLAAHSGKCDCCGAKKSGGMGWQVDHNHITGVIRGVLCFSCNTGIGKLGDTLEGVKNAVRYLEKGAAQ